MDMTYNPHIQTPLNVLKLLKPDTLTVNISLVVLTHKSRLCVLAVVLTCQPDCSVCLDPQGCVWGRLVYIL